MSNNRKTYSFKSVGQMQNDFVDQAVQVVKKNPIGIKTPISFGGTSGQMFSMNYNIGDQIKDNLKNLLLTNSGERLMLTDFGANLRPLAFELSNDDVAAEAIRRISSAVSKYMPFVSLDTFESRTESSENGSTVGIVVRVGYSVPTIGAFNQFVESIIYAAG